MSVRQWQYYYYMLRFVYIFILGIYIYIYRQSLVQSLESNFFFRQAHYSRWNGEKHRKKNDYEITPLMTIFSSLNLIMADQRYIINSNVLQLTKTKFWTLTFRGTRLSSSVEKKEKTWCVRKTYTYNVTQFYVRLSCEGGDIFYESNVSKTRPKSRLFLYQ